jgi:hypothetical protein
MKTKLIAAAAAAAVAAFAIIGGLFGVILPAQAQSNTTENAASNMSMNTGGDMMRTLHESSANHKWGMISSINNDGEEDWIISGHWMMEMAPQNDTATSNATTTSMISNVTGFNAILHMVMLDGSAMHNHEISNFTQVEDSTFDSETNTTTISGTSTVTMREVPVPNVQTTIELAQDSVIAISLDPDALEDHFGDEPIYGIVVSPEMLEEMKMRYGDKMGMGMMHGPMDSGMMNSSGGS